MSYHALLFALLSVCFDAGENRPASPEAGKTLLIEGDALADKNEPTEAVLKYKLAFEQLLPGMRKLAFKTEVKRDVTAREDLRAFLIQEIDEDSTPEEFKADELGMKALGLIPLDLDLKETLVKVYSEEIAAFYDPRTKTMHLIKETPVKDQKAPSFLERLMGKTTGFNKDESKTVIAHELTHALADQNYDLQAMQKKIKDDDDRSMALSALIEGEATLTMIAAQMNDWTGDMIKELQADDLDRGLKFMGPLITMGSGKSLKNAPPILAETMIFPYIRGLVFCTDLINRNNWSAIDEAYKNPPLSTEQILHPEKYRGPKLDLPTKVDLGTLPAGTGWTEIGQNVVGEMQLGVMLKRITGGAAAAAGWDGDRYAVFEGAQGKLGLVWFSTWDSEKDATEYLNAYVRFQTKKLGSDVSSPEAVPDSNRRPSSGVFYALERRGADVVVVEGFDSATTESLIEAAFKAKKTEMK